MKNQCSFVFKLLIEENDYVYAQNKLIIEEIIHNFGTI